MNNVGKVQVLEALIIIKGTLEDDFLINLKSINITIFLVPDAKEVYLLIEKDVKINL